MNNANFIKNLQNISHNRFALNALNDDDFYVFYCQLLSEFGINTPDNWYLIGTESCHLCHLAQQTLDMSHTKATYLDLMDSSQLIIDTLGTHIPLLLTPKKMLCCPFGLMDILTLTQSCHLT